MKITMAIMLLLFLIEVDYAQLNTPDSTVLTMDSTDLAMDSALVLDSVNIREMVQQQIVAAKKKMLEGKATTPQVLNSNLKKVLKENDNEKSFNILETIKVFIAKSNEDFARVILLGGSTFLVFGTVLIRRIKIKKRSISRRKLVKNINSIREEKIVLKDDPKLKNVRTKLKNNPEHYSEENSFDVTAKELNISKGELLLAAKIKSYELSKITT
jgi:hypothetical protein